MFLDFWRISNSVFNRGKSAIQPLYNDPEVLSSASDNVKFFAGNFSVNSNLDDSENSLYAFPSKSNLKLHNIPATPKFVVKVLENLDLLKVFGHDCIPVVFLKTCGPKFSYILAELFIIHQKESCLLDFQKVLSMVPVFKNVRERSVAKNYCCVSFLSLVSRIFEKLGN